MSARGPGEGVAHFRQQRRRRSSEFAALIASLADSQIWSTRTFQPLYIIHPCDDTSGDIFSLAWDDREGGTLYFGAQNTSIEWVNFGQDIRGTRPVVAPTAVKGDISNLLDGQPHEHHGHPPPSAPTPSQRSGRYKPSPFFDTPSTPGSPGSCTPAGRCTPSRSINCGKGTAGPATASGDYFKRGATDVVEFEVDADSTLFYAHYGYVYALQMIARADGTRWLASGSGDSDVKVWECLPGGGLKLVREFVGLSGAVFSLAYRDSLLYGGLQGGEIDVWDLETGSRIRTIEAHSSDVLSLTVLHGDVYSGAGDGRIFRIDDAFNCTAALRAHDSTALAMVIVPADRDGAYDLVTAGNDSYVKIWRVRAHPSRLVRSPEEHRDLQLPELTELSDADDGDTMLYALSKLVAIPTVSDELHREPCRQGAHLLNKILAQLGAKSLLLSGDQGKNPLVLATFSGHKPTCEKPRRRVLFYGHYDVQPVGEKGWSSDPWHLTGKDGYLYGRGVTDNKGPIMAIACAAAALRQRRELDVDLVMLIEGEEEAGSRGFASAVRRHRAAIGDVDVILLSNSTWIDEEDPCVVYGMRGVVYANLSIESQRDDVHSGVEGGAVHEPMFDMVNLLSKLSDTGGLKVPGFYDSVRPESDEERSLLESVATASGRRLRDLERVWREPSFSIANIRTSGSTQNKTVIPRRVTADISLRLVPDQDMSAIVDALTSYCRDEFERLSSPNHLDVKITHAASWWLAALDNPFFKALENAVEDVWKRRPLKIREGGTVPTMSWLEKEFGVPCVHLPLGQASDAGHLANERMRLLNLTNGKKVFERYLVRLAAI